MTLDQLKEYYKKGVTIKRRNDEDLEDVEFNMISEGKIDRWVFEPEELEQVKVLEEKTKRAYEAAETTKVTPMETKDGKVVLKLGAPFHRAIQDKQAIKNIAAGGILASEWFGAPESAGEGAFCAFLNTVVTQEHLDKTIAFTGYRKQNIRAQHADTRQCVFYFDDTNPIMQTLMQMDYFEYEHVKNNTPEDLPKLYPQEVIDLFDKLIEPNSGGGKTFHDNPEYKFYDWLAIPGGIPPQLINGLCVHSSREDILEDLSQIQKAFPNATIFDENDNVLSYALNSGKQTQP